MPKPTEKQAGELYRRFFKLTPTEPNPNNKGYIPSHLREGFDEAKIEKLPYPPQEK